MKKLRLFLTCATLLAAVTSAAACTAKEPKLSGFEPALPAPTSDASAAPTGGIFNAAAGYAPLHFGTRAARMGDPVTIVLIESTTASKSVSSKSQKSGGASITPPVAGPLAINPDALNASSTSSFNGGGNAAQSSILSSTLAVTIAEVRANGTALVKGEKKMLVSQGDEWIRFSGIIRLADIDDDNRVLSSRVADARIEYTGKGAIMRSGRQGWLGQFFNMISPF